MNTSPFINSDLNKQAQALGATLSRTTNSYHSETSGFEFGNKNSFAKKSERSEEKSSPQAKQEVEELQAFAFSIVTVNAEHTKPRFKRKLRG